MSGRSGNAARAQGANVSPIKRGRRLPYCLLLVAALIGAATVTKRVSTAFPTTKPRSQAEWARLYAALPLSFEANLGQTHPNVNFISRGRGYSLFLTGDEAVLTLKSQSPASPSPLDRKNPLAAAKTASPKSDIHPNRAESVLRMKLVGANARAKVAGTEELPGKANYFIGNDPSKWRTNVPTFAKVRYENIYPGVNLVYYGTREGELEYDFVVAPGADPNSITLGINAGAHAPLRIDPNGNLVVGLPSGNLELHKPVVYQPARSSQSPAEQRQAVPAHYTLDAQNYVRFECGPYDHSRELVIDPVLIYATYLGGTGGDIGYAITVNSTTDDAYIAGVTNSTNFPLSKTPGVLPYQNTNKGDGDAFVSQLDSAGSKVVYSTYIGGSGSDTATAITLFNSNAYITGYTTSADFPVMAPPGSGTTTPFQQLYSGNTDAFVLELNNLGSVLVYSTYLGGSGADFGQGIVVDSSGNAYVAGTTQSSNFPVLNAYQPNSNGGQDAFVSELNFTGENLLYSTYLGGSRAETGQAIALDKNNNIYLTGYTNSPDFPIFSPLQAALGGGVDTFVTELKADGTPPEFSTYLGGSADDRAYGIALDGSQNIYITGATTSTDFPTTAHCIQTSLQGASNAFFSKLAPAGASLLYSTFLGGSGTDQANAIAVTPGGAAFITGFTNSSDFPTSHPIQAILGLSNNGLCGTAPCQDAFVAQIDLSQTIPLVYSTYLGGDKEDFGQGIAVDTTGNPFITGSTSSDNFPAIAGGSFSSALTGNAGNAFLAKIDPVSEPNLAILPSNVNFGNVTITTTSPFQQILLVNPSDAPLTITSIVQQTLVSAFDESSTDNCVGTLPGGGGTCMLNFSFTPPSVGTSTGTYIITDNAGGDVGTQQDINFTGSGVTAATAVTVQPTNMVFGSQAVGTTSAPQTATVTNTGTQILNITKILPGSVNYAETDNCLSAPYNGVLGVGQSCTISITFTPTSSGTLPAALTISDNAVGSPQSILLSGTATAAFTLTEITGTNSQTVNPALIGSTQTTFQLQANLANKSSNFNGAISLSCSAGTTCAFSANPVFIGQPTAEVMTVSNLTPTPSSNPYPFTVTGTSGSQTYTLPLSLQFSDFALTASPSSFSVESGSIATYTININPIFGLNNEPVSLEVSNTSPPMADYVPTFSPNPATVNSTGPTQVKLAIQTTLFLNPSTPAVGSHVFPRLPSGPIPPLFLGILSLLALASLAIGHRRRTLTGRLGRGWLALRLGALASIMVLNLAMAACRPPTFNTVGTATGNYVVTIQGTLLNNTSVTHRVAVALSVTQGQPQ